MVEVVVAVVLVLVLVVVVVVVVVVSHALTTHARTFYFAGRLFTWPITNHTLLHPNPLLHLTLLHPNQADYEAGVRRHTERLLRRALADNFAQDKTRSDEPLAP